MSQTAITYPQVVVTEMAGRPIRANWEDICDNLINPDPYYQQAGHGADRRHELQLRARREEWARASATCASASVR